MQTLSEYLFSVVVDDREVQQSVQCHSIIRTSIISPESHLRALYSQVVYNHRYF